MASRSRPSLATAARLPVLGAAIIVITTLTTGWLYWVRAAVAAWPGPMVRQVLPLDAMAGHDRIPLVVCILGFGLAGLLLGLVARALGLGRLTAGLSLAVGVGCWLFLVDAVCLFIVLQEPLSAVLRATVGLQPIYLAAVLAGCCGALLGRIGSGARPVGAATLLAWLVATGGLIDLVSAVVPRPDVALGAIERFGPGVVYPAVHALVVPVGALLLISSRGLIRQSKRAWQLSVALLGVSVVLHLLLGRNHATAIVTALIAVVLVARRQDFPFSGDPGSRPSALLRLAGMLALAVTYGVTAVVSYQIAADVSVSLPAALSDTARALVGMHPVHEGYLPHDFSRWFPVPVLSVEAIGLIWAADVWLRPWRQRLFSDAARRERATGIVRKWGGDTLAPFALRADKEWFIHGQTLIAYRVLRGVAVVSGDPIGPAEEAGPALDDFLAHARARGWHVAVLGASDRRLQIYRDRGLRPHYHGDEAVIDVAAFSLDGRRMRTVRQAVHRLERRGYTAEAVTARDVSPSLRGELAAIDAAWLRGRVRKGFAMEFDSLFRLAGGDAVFLIGRGPDGRVAGCLHMAVCAPSGSLSLSSMPRRADTPNGFSAWLIANAVTWAKDNGFDHVSLNFAPFAALMSADTALSSAQRLERGALLTLKRALALQLDNLVRFDKQFCPRWQARYVVIERRSDLPRVVLAAMAAEGYLPHADLIRGADWVPRGGDADEEPAGTGRDSAAAAACDPGRSAAERARSAPPAGVGGRSTRDP